MVDSTVADRVEVPESQPRGWAVLGVGLFLGLIWCFVVTLVIVAASDEVAGLERWAYVVVAVILGLKGLLWSAAVVVGAVQAVLCGRWRPRLRIWPAKVRPGETVRCEVELHPRRRRKISAASVGLMGCESSGDVRWHDERKLVCEEIFVGPDPWVVTTELVVPHDAPPSAGGVRWRVEMSSSAIGLTADLEVLATSV